MSETEIKEPTIYGGKLLRSFGNLERLEDELIVVSCFVSREDFDKNVDAMRQSIGCINNTPITDDNEQIYAAGQIILIGIELLDANEHWIAYAKFVRVKSLYPRNDFSWCAK